MNACFSSDMEDDLLVTTLTNETVGSKPISLDDKATLELWEEQWLQNEIDLPSEEPVLTQPFKKIEVPSHIDTLRSNQSAMASLRYEHLEEWDSNDEEEVEDVNTETVMSRKDKGVEVDIKQIFFDHFPDFEPQIGDNISITDLILDSGTFEFCIISVKIYSMNYYVMIRYDFTDLTTAPVDIPLKLNTNGPRRTYSAAVARTKCFPQKRAKVAKLFLETFPQFQQFMQVPDLLSDSGTN